MAEERDLSNHSEQAGEGELAGRTAVVTGAARGIGRAIALELAAAGAHVVVHTRRRREDAEEVAAAISRLGQKAPVVLFDLRQANRLEAFAADLWQQSGGIDIWVNNAGADVLTGEAAEWSFEEKLELLWKVDVLATIRLSRCIGRQMKARKGPPGAIVNMSWDQAAWGMGGESGEMFAAIKGSVAAFSRSLACSLAPQVRVNCLAPGWIQTDWGQTASPSWQDRARQEALLGRWGTPEDVARAARFLVSPAAAFINGQVLPVNGGFRHGHP